MRLIPVLVVALATFIVIGCGGSDDTAQTTTPGDTPAVSPTSTLIPVSATNTPPVGTAAPTVPPVEPTQPNVPTPTTVSVASICPTGQPAEILPGDVPPNIFLGTATLNGDIVPDGTNVTSCIDGEPVATALVLDGRFLIIVEQRIPSIEGKEITFSVGGFDANEKAVWALGGAELLDLSAES